MKITELEVRAVKGIRYVHLRPRAGTTIIGGANAAGKSSLLDSIAMAIGGAKLIPKHPIRAGQNEAVIKVKLDGNPDGQLPPITVTRTFIRREDGTIKSELAIVDESTGMAAASPQGLLNDAMGRKRLGTLPIGFDPHFFATLPPGEQVELLQGLVGLDFSDIDAAARDASERRRSLNREAQERKAALTRLPHYPDAPESPIDLATLLAASKSDTEVLRENDRERQRLKDCDRQIHMTEDAIQLSQGQILQLNARLAEARNVLERHERELKTALSAHEKQAAKVQSLVDPDLESRSLELQQAQTKNAQYEANKKRGQEEQVLSQINAKSTELTAKLDSLAAERAARTSAAKWPLDGLGFDEEVTLHGRPLSQLSSAERLEISVAIGAAMNPTLNVMFIREASLLDDAHKVKIAELAARYGSQIFLEVVGSESCHVVLKDGEIETCDDELLIQGNLEGKVDGHESNQPVPA